MGKTRHTISRFLFYDLAAAHRKLHVSLNHRLKELDVQVETWRVLETLSSDEGLTMGELAEIVLMNPPTLTKLVDRMVANGRSIGSWRRRTTAGFTWCSPTRAWS